MMLDYIFHSLHIKVGPYDEMLDNRKWWNLCRLLLLSPFYRLDGEDPVMDSKAIEYGEATRQEESEPHIDEQNHP